MSKIENYAIIDHVGSLDSGEDSKRIYHKVYDKSKADGFKFGTVYKMKDVCLANSPYCKEVTDKMKFWVRYNKHPKKVYLICDSTNAKVENVFKIWTERNIEVELFEARPFEATHKIDVGEAQDRKRHIAEIWADAIGWEFSAPLFRIQTENNADIYMKRSDQKELQDRGVKVTKITSRPEKFLEQQRCIATDEEVDAFFEHYMWLHKSGLLAQMLEPDYSICRCCHKPIRMGKTEIIRCRFCDNEINVGIGFDTYYDDSYREDEDTYLD